MIKQVIVMRKDLNMRRGKQISQGCHASLKVFFDIMEKEHHSWSERMWIGDDSNVIKTVHYKFKATPEMEEWIEGSFTKICVSVDSEAQVLEVYNKALSSGIPCSLITDSGLTEFNGIPTITCSAIGPDDSEKIDKITGGLKLL